MTMSFISTFSILGIAIGVATIVTVMSVMNGFQSEIKNRMLDFFNAVRDLKQ